MTGTFNQAMTLTVFVDTPTMPLTVDVAGGGTGTVTSSPSGLNCTPATTPCTLNVTPNQAVTLTATPDTEQSFAGWQGGCAGTSPTCQVTVDQAKWAVARFAPAPTIAVTYYHLDAVGSVRALSDESGAILQRHDYGAFGEDMAPLTGDPRRFTGKELDPESAWMSSRRGTTGMSWGGSRRWMMPRTRYVLYLLHILLSTHLRPSIGIPTPSIILYDGTIGTVTAWKSLAVRLSSAAPAHCSVDLSGPLLGASSVRLLALASSSAPSR